MQAFFNLHGFLTRAPDGSSSCRSGPADARAQRTLVAATRAKSPCSVSTSRASWSASAELAVTVAASPPLPRALAGIEVHAGENASVEAEGISVGGHAGQPGGGQQRHGTDTIDRHRVRRAVAVAAIRREPPRRAGVPVVAGERADRADDDRVVHHQRRGREPPAGAGRVELGRHVARPDPGSGPRIERVQDAGAAKRRRRGPSRVGVKRGAAPACESQNRTWSVCLRIGSPVPMR